jgi:hypothetical protein
MADPGRNLEELDEFRSSDEVGADNEVSDISREDE